jgi:hypothetical protein
MDLKYYKLKLEYMRKFKDLIEEYFFYLNKINSDFYEIIKNRTEDEFLTGVYDLDRDIISSAWHTTETIKELEEEERSKEEYAAE